jgi:hypothetical protein
MLKLILFLSREGNGSWHFGEIRSEGRMWTQVVQDRVEWLAFVSAVIYFFSVGYLLMAVLLNHLSMSEDYMAIFLPACLHSGFFPSKVKHL